MWTFVLTISLLCCASEAVVTCKNNNDATVDWWGNNYWMIWQPSVFFFPKLPSLWTSGSSYTRPLLSKVDGWLVWSTFTWIRLEPQSQRPTISSSTTHAASWQTPWGPYLPPSDKWWDGWTAKTATDTMMLVKIDRIMWMSAGSIRGHAQFRQIKRISRSLEQTKHNMKNAKIKTTFWRWTGVTHLSRPLCGIKIFDSNCSSITWSKASASLIIFTAAKFWVYQLQRSTPGLQRWSGFRPQQRWTATCTLASTFTGTSRPVFCWKDRWFGKTAL